MRIQRPSSSLAQLLRQLGQKPRPSSKNSAAAPANGMADPEHRVRSAVVAALQSLPSEKRHPEQLRQVFIETVIGSAWAHRLSLGELQAMRDDILQTVVADPQVTAQFDRVIAEYL